MQGFRRDFNFFHSPGIEDWGFGGSRNLAGRVLCPIAVTYRENGSG